MSRTPLYLAVFLVGLLAVCWIGFGYVGSNPLGAAVALLIGLCYLAGALELHRYRQATSSLRHAVDDLTGTPPGLGAWLERLHPGLRTSVRLRIEGERVALPAPSLTPYLVGLLVLLGMLGTLLGMMATLRGTGLALESATDLQAIRGSLAAPVKGLGFAFGTSIAGVASSAMLGLLSALLRRERLEVVQALDAKASTTLRVFSQAHRRDETFRLLQQQTEVMPALVDRLQAMMASVEQQGVAASERQLASQEAFHAATATVYTGLAESVRASLQDSVAESARAASAAFQPVMAATMEGLARETSALHDTVTHAVQAQLDGLAAGFAKSTAEVATIWHDALARQQAGNATLVQHLQGALDDHGAALASRHHEALAAAAATFDAHTASLVHAVNQSHAELQDVLASRDAARLSTWSDALAAMTASLQAQWEAAAADAIRREAAICDTLERTATAVSASTEAHAGATIAEMARLVEAAAEAPRAAAEVVAELRQKLSDSMLRDTAMLDERNRLLATLETLLDAVNHASTEQRTAVDALVTTSADLLERVGTRFGDQVEAGARQLDAVAAQLTGSTAEVAGLGEAFGSAVQLFGESNEALAERLQHIAGALDGAMARSDEQLAYYVAQAREVVDLSVLSQKQIIEEMQQLARQRTSGAADA
jgi:hypothetical protein